MTRPSVLSFTDHESRTKHCDLCAGHHFEPVSQTDRKGRPLGTVVCRDCGLVVHEQVPSEQELTDFYTDRYRQEYHGETVPSARRIVRAWHNGARMARQLRDYFVPGDDVCEIGAGIGCTVKQFELQGCHAMGIEPHSGFQAYGATRLHARLVQAELFDLPPIPSHDLVLLVHVIEHFRSPRAALNHLAKIVRPGGLLYVECPNLAAPFALPSKMFHYAHIHNFTPWTLEMMAAGSGFRVLKQFGGERHPNLQVLFVRERPETIRIPESYERTWEALRRHNPVSYHLRWGYLAPRVAKVTGYAWEHLTARRELETILRRCDESPGRAARAAA